MGKRIMVLLLLIALTNVWALAAENTVPDLSSLDTYIYDPEIDEGLNQEPVMTFGFEQINYEWIKSVVYSLESPQEEFVQLLSAIEVINQYQNVLQYESGQHPEIWHLKMWLDEIVDLKYVDEGYSSALGKEMEWDIRFSDHILLRVTAENEHKLQEREKNEIIKMALILSYDSPAEIPEYTQYYEQDNIVVNVDIPSDQKIIPRFSGSGQ